HGAEGDEVVEEVDAGGGPPAEAVVPEDEGDDTASEDAIDLDGDEVGFEGNAFGEDFHDGDGKQNHAGAPEGAGGNFGRKKPFAEGAALAAVAGPKEARATSKYIADD